VKALLIAGGFGTRLRPLTNTRPKHLLPVANRPHLLHVFDLLERHGIEEVILLTSYLAEAFEGVAEAGRRRGLTVHVAHEPVPLGTAGAMKNAESFIGDETFLAFNGDILTSMDLTEILAWHRERRAEATIVLRQVDDPSVFGVVPTDDDGRVLGFIEKPPPGEAPTDLINAGVYILQPSILDRIPAGEEWSAERALFPGLVADGARLYATPTNEFWMDVGTPAKYLAANMDALDGSFATDAAEGVDAHGVLRGSSAAVAPGARISSACLGDGAVVEEGALVERCVLLPGAFVGAGAEVRDSILGAGARVAPGVTASGVTLGDGEHLTH